MKNVVRVIMVTVFSLGLTALVPIQDTEAGLASQPAAASQPTATCSFSGDTETSTDINVESTCEEEFDWCLYFECQWDPGNCEKTCTELYMECLGY